VVNEKVYTVSLFSIVLTLWLAVRWADRPAGERPDRYLAAIVYLLALTSANHQMGLLAAPAILLLVVATDRWTLVRPRLVAVALLAALAAGTVYLYLPIRAAFDPYLNEGAPTTWRALHDVLTRAQFGKPPLTARQATFPAQLGMYLQYFGWQWGRDLGPGVAAGLAAVFGGLGLLGAWRHWRAEPRQAAVMITLMLTVTVVLVFYLNFRYGYSEFPGRSLDREVRERDYFFIVSFSAWGVWVAIGLAALMERVAAALAARVPSAARRWRYALPIAGLALVPLALNRLTASRHGETLARDFARDLLESVDPYAIIVTGGDNDTFPLWYAQEVEGVRRDVTVMVTSLANLDWYLRQMEQRPVATFDPEAAPAWYRDRAWPRPESPWLGSLYRGGPEAADSLPPYSLLERPMTGQLGPITVGLDPSQTPNRGFLDRSDLAVLTLTKLHLGRRPIYFSSTVGDYPDRLGFAPYLVTEGLVRRLLPAPVAPSDSIRASQVQGRYVNVPRTRALAFQVYHAASVARPRPRGWVDRASENSLLPYIMIYDTLAELLQQADPTQSARALAVARGALANTSYQFDLGLPLTTPQP
jgi:hypothetical protein